MSEVNVFAMEAEHQAAKDLLLQWTEDIARWQEEQERAAGMLEAIMAAWERTRGELEDHAQRIRRFEEHLARHEEELRKAGWPASVGEHDSTVFEHQEFQRALAEASTAHDKMQALYVGVMVEVFELLKLTHPDAVVLETN